MLEKPFNRILRLSSRAGVFKPLITQWREDLVTVKRLHIFSSQSIRVQVIPHRDTVAAFVHSINPTYTCSGHSGSLRRVRSSLPSRTMRPTSNSRRSLLLRNLCSLEPWDSAFTDSVNSCSWLQCCHQNTIYTVHTATLNLWTKQV